MLYLKTENFWMKLGALVIKVICTVYVCQVS